jgi:membrane protein EpsK
LSEPAGNEPADKAANEIVEPPITTSRRLMLNTALNVSNQLITACINFVLIGFFLDTIGVEQYGVWILVGSIFSYRTMLTMGLNAAVNRHIPVYVARGDQEGIRRVISTGFAYYLMLGTVIALASLALYWNIEDWFIIDQAFIATAEQLALIVGLSYAVSMSFQHFPAVLSGYQRFDIITYTTLATIIARTLLIVGLLSQGLGLLAMGIIYGGAEIMIRVVSAIYSRRLTKGLSPSPGSVDLSLLREMLTYGVSSTLYNSGTMLVFKSADLVIGSLIAAAAVPRFFLAAAPIMVLIELVQVFSRVIKPAVSDLDARNDDKRTEELVFLSQKYTLMLIFPAVAFFVVMGGSLIRVWVGDRFTDPETLAELTAILAILAVGAGTRLTQYSNFMVLVGKGFHRVHGMTALGTTLACVIAAYASVQYGGGGLVAVAWSCSIPVFLTSSLILPAYFNYKMEIKASATLRQSWLPAIAGCTPGILLMLVWNQLAPPESWSALLAVVVAVGGATALGAWLFTMSDLERKRIRRFLPM